MNKSTNINNYITELEIEGQTISLFDRNAWRRDQRKRNRNLRRFYQAGKLLEFISICIGFLGFIYISGIMGHADFVAEMGIADDWSMTQYILHIAIGAVMMLLSFVIYQIGRCCYRIKRSI